MDSEFKRAMAPSLALLMLASLTPEGHQVQIQDENITSLLLNDDPDLVGITVNVDTSARAYKIAAHYRERGVKVILGGIHASANPAEALRHADAVCVGEAENLWAGILADAASGHLRSIYRSSTPTDLRARRFRIGTWRPHRGIFIPTSSLPAGAALFDAPSAITAAIM
jgi:radical SAM superfamily enzyme YgiQ (UPF0313 family)